MFWILALSLAVAAALIIILPLLRADGAVVPGRLNDAEVYRDQLREVERDAGDGLIGPEEAAQARTEIARRLISASEAKTGEGRRHGRASAILLAAFVAVFVPVSGYLLYGETGSPDAPDQPLAARMASADPDINILIAKTEAHLSTHPDDGKGWELLAPIYMRAMRADDAANAWKNAIRLLGGDAERYGSLGEALSVAAKGEVTPDSLSAFGQSLKFDPKDPRSRFYVALADAQAGNFDRALEGFKALKADSPADAPWIGVVDNQIEQVSAMKAGGPKLGNPNAADIEAAAGMDAGDRMQMIRSMVESLDEKLKTEPDNFEGWMRLVRSYGVLKEPEKAADALKRGLAAFPPDSDNGKALLALADEMGIATGGAAK